MIFPSNHFISEKTRSTQQIIGLVLVNQVELQPSYDTSTPVIWTGIYPHMPISVTAHSLRHWLSPSKPRPVVHTTHGPRLSSQVCRTRLTTVEWVIDFSIFDIGGLPLSQSSPKGEMTYYPPRSTILQNFSPITQTVYEMSYQSFSLFGLGG